MSRTGRLFEGQSDMQAKFIEMTPCIILILHNNNHACKDAGCTRTPSDEFYYTRSM